MNKKEAPKRSDLKPMGLGHIPVSGEHVWFYNSVAELVLEGHYCPYLDSTAPWRCSLGTIRKEYVPEWLAYREWGQLEPLTEQELSSVENEDLKGAPAHFQEIVPRLAYEVRQARKMATAPAASSPIVESGPPSIQQVLEKWVGVRPGELDEDAVPLFLSELALAGLQVAPVLQPAEQAEAARATFVQQAYAYKSTFPGLPEGYTHEDIDKLFEWADGVDDLLRTAPKMLAAPLLVDAVAAPSLEAGDKQVIEAVRVNADTHEGVYISSKAAKRLIRLIDNAYPTTA